MHKKNDFTVSVGVYGYVEQLNDDIEVYGVYRILPDTSQELIKCKPEMEDWRFIKVED